MRTLIGYFLRGCLAILPIAATVYVAFVVVATIDHWVPVGKLVYTSIRDLLGAFVGQKKRFDRPVAVTIVPGSRARMLGFVTRDRLEALGMKDEVAVYFPQSYNFAGYLAVVPREQ